MRKIFVGSQHFALVLGIFVEDIDRLADYFLHPAWQVLFQRFERSKRCPVHVLDTQITIGIDNVDGSALQHRFVQGLLWPASELYCFSISWLELRSPHPILAFSRLI